MQQKLTKGVKLKPSKYDKVLGSIIKMLRCDKNIKQEVIASTIGISMQQYQKYESGKTKWTLEIIQAISIELGFDCMSDLIKRLENEIKERDKMKA